MTADLPPAVVLLAAVRAQAGRDDVLLRDCAACRAMRAHAHPPCDGCGVPWPGCYCDTEGDRE